MAGASARILLLVARHHQLTLPLPQALCTATAFVGDGWDWDVLLVELLMQVSNGAIAACLHFRRQQQKDHLRLQIHFLQLLLLLQIYPQLHHLGLALQICSKNMMPRRLQILNWFGHIVLSVTLSF